MYMLQLISMTKFEKMEPAATYIHKDRSKLNCHFDFKSFLAEVSSVIGAENIFYESNHKEHVSEPYESIVFTLITQL